MPPVIQQSVRFRATPQQLFALYLDSRKHSLATGAPAKLSRKIGGKFRAYGKSIGGKNLFIHTGRMVVQTWRARFWKKGDWSILIITFSKIAGGTQVDLVHAGVPEYDQKGVRAGWPKYYWKPWKRYLSEAKGKKKS